MVIARMGHLSERSSGFFCFFNRDIQCGSGRALSQWSTWPHVVVPCAAETCMTGFPVGGGGQTRNPELRLKRTQGQAPMAADPGQTSVIRTNQGQPVCQLLMWFADCFQLAVAELPREEVTEKHGSPTRIFCHTPFLAAFGHFWPCFAALTAFGHYCLLKPFSFYSLHSFLGGHIYIWLFWLLLDTFCHFFLLF